jgi:hypothetical protein
MSADSELATKLSLTPEEKRAFAQLFRQADTDNVGVVTGEVAVKFFEKTRLDSRVLGEVRNHLLIDIFPSPTSLASLPALSIEISLVAVHALSYLKLLELSSTASRSTLLDCMQETNLPRALIDMANR